MNESFVVVCVRERESCRGVCACVCVCQTIMSGGIVLKSLKLSSHEWVPFRWGAARYQVISCCVCVRERERESHVVVRERERESHVVVCVCVCLCVCMCVYQYIMSGDIVLRSESWMNHALVCCYDWVMPSCACVCVCERESVSINHVRRYCVKESWVIYQSWGIHESYMSHTWVMP